MCQPSRFYPRLASISPSAVWMPPSFVENFVDNLVEKLLSAALSECEAGVAFEGGGDGFEELCRATGCELPVDTADRVVVKTFYGSRA
jgi:hypothetical protein